MPDTSGSDISSAQRHLIIVAGVSCAGKTTIINRILNGEESELINLLATQKPAEWAHKIRQIDIERTPRLIMHYDISRDREFRRQPSFSSDTRLQICNLYDEISIITVWVDKEILCRRVKSRQEEIPIIIGRLKRLPIRIKRWIRRRRLLHRYADEKYVTDLYRQWFDYIAQQSINMHLVCDTSNDPPVVIPASDW